MFRSVPYLNDHFCLISNQNLTLSGLYGGVGEYTYLNVYFIKCFNGGICDTQDNVMSKLSNVRLSIKFPDYWINHQDLQNPQQLIINANTIQVTSSTFKRIWYYIKTIEYETDFGYVFNDNKISKFYQFNDQFETVDLRTTQTVPNSFCQFSFIMDKNRINYTRGFAKIQSVIANSGGLIKAVTVLAFIINELLFCELYYIDIIKNVLSKGSNSTPPNKNRRSSVILFENSSQNQIKLEESITKEVKQSFFKKIKNNNYLSSSYIPNQFINKNERKSNISDTSGVLSKTTSLQKTKAKNMVQQDVVIKRTLQAVRNSFSKYDFITYYSGEFLQLLPKGLFKCHYRQKKHLNQYQFLKSRIISLLDVKCILTTLYENEECFLKKLLNPQ
jgi:hypothetical protein